MIMLCGYNVQNTAFLNLKNNKVQTYKRMKIYHKQLFPCKQYYASWKLQSVWDSPVQAYISIYNAVYFLSTEIYIIWT